MNEDAYLHLKMSSTHSKSIMKLQKKRVFIALVE